MLFTDIIEKVNSDKRLKPDLMKSENGNNFRAVSESAILDVIDPILKEAHAFYTVEVKEQHLDIREAYGSKGKKLQFIATVTVALRFYSEENTMMGNTSGCLAMTEAVGMGIDDNDKAMGKAYTYAVKYALLKVFRLRYSDDPDFKASEPLLVEKSEKPAEKAQKVENSTKKNNQNSKEMAMTEKQRDYILGLMKSKSVDEKVILSKFSVEPSIDEYIPMKVARAIIKFLEEEADDLPF